MHFDQLDKTMRVFETNADQCVLPGINRFDKFLLNVIDSQLFPHQVEHGSEEAKELVRKAKEGSCRQEQSCLD